MIQTDIRKYNAVQGSNSKHCPIYHHMSVIYNTPTPCKEVKRWNPSGWRLDIQLKCGKTFSTKYGADLTLTEDQDICYTHCQAIYQKTQRGMCSLCHSNNLGKDWRIFTCQVKVSTQK